MGTYAYPLGPESIERYGSGGDYSCRQAPAEVPASTKVFESVAPCMDGIIGVTGARKAGKACIIAAAHV